MAGERSLTRAMRNFTGWFLLAARMLTESESQVASKEDPRFEHRDPPEGCLTAVLYDSETQTGRVPRVRS